MADSFDWSRVRWDDAKAEQRDDCSYCGALIDDDEIPLRMWNQRGDCCVFCQHCDVNALRAVMDVQRALDRLDRGDTWMQPSKSNRRPTIEETRRLLIRPAKRGPPRLH